jgi:DNA-binding response OmpR family regulator
MSIPSILVVEDNEQLNRLYCKALRHAHYQVAYAYSVADAVAALNTTMPNAIILDMQLGDGDGFAVLRHLESLTPKILPFRIVASGHQQYEQHAKLSNVDFFLYKPVSVTMIVDMLKRLLPISIGVL